VSIKPAAGHADPTAIIDAIERERITHLFLPPTVVYMLLAVPGVETRDFSSLRHFFVGAAPMSLEKLRQAIDVFGPVMTEAFGQSEAPAAICCKTPRDYMGPDGAINLKRLGSVGRPAVFNQVQLLLDDGAEAAHGEPGEICVRGSLVNPAYLDDSDGPIVDADGWRHTGDIGVMDPDGFITMVDRKKDMIITGGFNVYPNEVEQVLMEHSAIQDCAVIGVPDPKWGEAVKAVVLLRADGKADADALIALVRDRLGGVKAPKSVDFVDTLPRSPTGKVLKAELRSNYWKGQTRAIA
jgi:acyl-CoA synthetase (AMP-forming)/AMP-acid ligase II